MNIFVLLLLHFFVPVELATLEELFDDIDTTYLIRTENETEREHYGIVHDARRCGGRGQFIEMRMESCNTSTFPCLMENFTSPRRLELEYIPSINITKLRRRLITTVDGKFASMFEGDVENANITEGVPAVYAIDVYSWKENNGKLVTLQLSLFHLVDGVVEICAEGDFQHVGQTNAVGRIVPHVQCFLLLSILLLALYAHFRKL